ncbi:MAG: sulfoxide reductase heme-binding subunit YedZ [Gammaproteobacteria bacterium]|nr:sulfoxide reductase heme-binding subunit YedZ [Gammaproteobacteria bacterium]MDH5594359.1 sulfoxide reductase heme-binding subunit YedZ [Gammaproteobacteria bacterium]MDH5614689.1 sulfoxide reductase heme-binding subunit YedZ [Gammaproteobacteria bacterium]
MEQKTISLLKGVVFVVCLIPAILLFYNAFTDNLGANPVEEITLETGTWALRFLVLTLAITPLRKIFGWSILIRFRRMLGLYVFFYACLHFLAFIWFDHFFELDEMIKDVIKRPFITMGFISFVMLMPLAMTSTNKMMKRLGGKRWQQLHRLVYVIPFFVVIHYLWKLKADFLMVGIYTLVFSVLLLWRLWYRYSNR